MSKDAPMAVNIHAPGELIARRSEKIKGPDGLRSVGLYQLTIANLVPKARWLRKDSSWPPWTEQKWIVK